MFLKDGNVMNTALQMVGAAVGVAPITDTEATKPITTSTEKFDGIGYATADGVVYGIPDMKAIPFPYNTSTFDRYKDADGRIYQIFLNGPLLIENLPATRYGAGARIEWR